MKTNEGETVNIEIQAYDDFENIYKRFQYYACKNIASQIEEGDDYNQLKPFYQIVLYHEYDKKYHELQESSVIQGINIMTIKEV